MTLCDSKKKLALAGAGCGVVAAVLAFLGNPANMAFCIACFVRDMAGSLGMHQAEVVQYARPEIIGLVLGSFIISVATKEYRSTAGSSPMLLFYPWYDHYDWFSCILRMPIAYGDPYVSRRSECMGSIDRIYPWCRYRYDHAEERKYTGTCT